MANKRSKMQLRSDTRNHQSFSSRICDDLCEVILSYLSFEEKIRYECVSKQWNKLIFNKQNSLEVIRWSSNDSNNLIQLANCWQNNRYKYILNLNAFQTVLNKSKHIHQIIFNCDESNSEPALKLIIKYCSYLNEIKFNFNKISDRTLKRFGQQFGQKLRIIHFLNTSTEYNNKYKTLLKLCPNLTQVNKGFDNYLSMFVDNNQVLVPKLEKVIINYEIEDNQTLKTLVDKWENSLKTIEIMTYDENSVNSLSQLVKRLKLLKEFKLDLEAVVANCSLFASHLRSIAIKCNQINRLELTFGCVNQTLDNQIIKILPHFQNLKYLEFEIFSEFDEDDHDNHEILSESLKDCKNLIHLKLDSIKISDSFFKDIHSYLPKLKHLHIGVNNITDTALHSLAKLKDLQFISIDSDENEAFPDVTDIGIGDIINNCHQIRSINFNSRPNITNKTIELLIKFALSKPKVQFEHFFSFIGYEDDISDHQFTTIDLKDFGDLPTNLVIDY